MIDKCLSPRNRNRTWLIKDNYDYKRGGELKEIGEKLKEARESIGITIDEASEDLKTRPSQIENIEAGNMEAFKDIYSLKYFIRDYAKYLGLNKDDMVDDFNEFLFDYTSKISLDDIKKAKAENREIPKTKRILSPYTLEHKQKFYIPSFVFYIIIAFLLIVIIYFLTVIFNKEDFNDDNIVAISEVRRTKWIYQIR